jgi:hypothetical protein
VNLYSLLDRSVSILYIVVDAVLYFVRDRIAVESCSFDNIEILLQDKKIAPINISYAFGKQSIRIWSKLSNIRSNDCLRTLQYVQAVSSEVRRTRPRRIRQCPVL